MGASHFLKHLKERGDDTPQEQRTKTSLIRDIMMERFRTWHEILMELLSDPENVIGYLEVSLEEYLEDGDKAFFLK